MRLEFKKIGWLRGAFLTALMILTVIVFIVCAVVYVTPAGQQQFPGSNVPIVSYAASTPTTPVGATTIISQTPPGVYRVCYYSVVTTTGTVGTSFTLNLIYTDVQQGQTIAQFTNSTFTQGNVNQGCSVVQNQNLGAIQYSITEAGSFTVHPVLALRVYSERIY
jgi:hypothetical protein